MCPLVSGITTWDAALSAELGMRALDLSGGNTILPQSDDCAVPDDHRILQAGVDLVIELLNCLHG